MWAGLLALPTVLDSAVAQGHEIDAASLSLSQIEGGSFRVHWHASSRAWQDDMDSAIRFPPPCALHGDRLDCGDTGLAGTIAFPWLDGTLTRVVVDVQWLEGAHLIRVVTANSPALAVYGGATAGWRSLLPICRDYTKLGIEHIITGFDHLLFVVALTLLVRRRRQLLATVTAFTFAHSISLALTVLGLVSVASPPVEAAIALSIVLVCAECLRPTHSLIQRAPWVAAFAFGLLHGLGFASALLDLGVPERHVPSALVCFNLGVEIGQIAIITAVAAVQTLARSLLAGQSRMRWLPWTRKWLIYAMGGVAAYWLIDRIGPVVGL
jgi:hydrogenase/urease accessory protein HupE